MSGFLLDTNVLSEFNRRGEPDQRVRHWLETTPNLSTPAFSPLARSDLVSSFCRPVSDVTSWSDGLSATCTNGLKAESCRSINQSRIGGGCFALKRS